MHRWLGSRRVYTKILIAVGVAVIGTAATGVVSLVAIAKLENTRNVEVRQGMPYITALNHAALDSKTAANDEREFLNTGDISFRDKALSRRHTVSAALQDAHTAAYDPTRKAAAEEIQKSIDAWFDAVEATFKTFDTDPVAAATASRGPNYNLRMAYEALLITELYQAEKSLVAGREFGESADSTRLSILVLLIAALAIAVAVAFYITQLIVRPLRSVSGVLSAVADGDLTQDPAVDKDRRDEVGNMAAALRRATGTLRRTVGQLSEHAVVLANASEELATTSRQSQQGAETGSRQANEVAGLAADMSTTIATIAAGATEMGASIREISQNTAQAVTVASRAVQVTDTTNRVMGKLGDSSAEIGNVVKTITAIAEQTNLLALNATIEAARAGDAGKGFAVVASEVKDLAQETARATDDISQRVATIQQDTSGAVAAIDEISTIINQINEYQTTIASAVEEQSATTQEMSRSVEEASAVGHRVADTVGDVASAVQLTTSGIAESNRAASSLAEMSNSLRGIVQTFQY